MAYENPIATIWEKNVAAHTIHDQRLSIELFILSDLLLRNFVFVALLFLLVFERKCEDCLWRPIYDIFFWETFLQPSFVDLLSERENFGNYRHNS